MKNKRISGIMLILALMLTMMPGMSQIALADSAVFCPASDYSGFGALENSDDTVKIEGVQYNNADVDWYVIGYNSTANTVTLLSKQFFGKRNFAEVTSGVEYADSPIKSYVEGLTDDGQPLAGIKSALANISVTGEPNVTGAIPYLLSKAEAEALNTTKKKGIDEAGIVNSWWLRTIINNYGCILFASTNNVSDGWSLNHNTCGVRPALQLDLSKVFFDSGTKTFVLFVEYPIWVGGVQVTSANASNITGGTTATASYDASTKTLTLKGAEITKAYQYDTTHDASIYSLGNDLKIVLEGDNNIGSDGVYDGIYVAKDNSSGGNLIIEGSGTLNAKGKLNAISADGNLNIVGSTVDAQIISDNGAKAIHAGGSVTIADGKVTATAIGSADNAIDAFDAVYINGGTVNAIAKGNKACAVYGCKGVEINDGTVTATANGAEGRAICSDAGKVIIEDGTVSAAATGNEGCAIFGEDGGVSLTGGKITATSSYNETGAESVYGIYAQKTGITIREKANLISAGTSAALHCENDGKVKNTIAGSGWTDYEGTKGKRYISVNDDPGQTLEDYKKVQFPAVPDGVVIDAAQQVIDKIKALPDPEKVTLDDEAKINEAREAYEKLSAEDKAKVSNDMLKKLTDAESKVKELKKSAEDQEAASKVSGMIASIPDDLSKATSDQVSGAVEAYNSLTADQKALITESEVAKLQKALNYPAKMMKSKLKSVKASKGRNAIVKWGEKSGANGYQLYYKAKGVKAKKVNINSARTVKKTVKKLKAGKTYSFKVRTFTKVQNLADPDKPIKVYGKWSKAKKARAKK